MFANREIRYQRQRSPLTACTCTSCPTPPQRPVLLPRLPAERNTRSSKIQLPRSLTLPSHGVPGPGRALGAPTLLPPARHVRPQPTGEDGVGCARREQG